jgi:hypothetical protein
MKYIFPLSKLVWKLEFGLLWAPIISSGDNIVQGDNIVPGN